MNGVLAGLPPWVKQTLELISRRGEIGSRRGAEAQSFLGKGTGGGDLQEDWIFIPIFLIIFLCVSAALRESFFLEFPGFPRYKSRLQIGHAQKKVRFFLYCHCVYDIYIVKH